MNVYPPFTKEGRVCSGSTTGGRHRQEKTMKPDSPDDRRGLDKALLLKLGGLAVALGAITWLLAPSCFR